MVAVRNGLSATAPMVRMRSRSSFVRIGCDTSSRMCVEVPLRSSRFGRGPMKETSDITSSSRIGSMGGFVTCAKFCLK
jgi:hypothetical protein